MLGCSISYGAFFLKLFTCSIYDTLFCYRQNLLTRSRCHFAISQGKNILSARVTIIFPIKVMANPPSPPTITNISQCTQSHPKYKLRNYDVLPFFLLAEVAYNHHKKTLATHHTQLGPYIFFLQIQHQ